MEPTAGALLVASADLRDPNFAETVVLLFDVGPDGALGVVLNHPSVVPVEEVLPDWRDQVSEPGVLFRGGPVGTDGALAVGRMSGPADEPLGFQPVVDGLGLVDLDTPVEVVDDGLVSLRIFAGYAGWGDGQLEAEIAEGSWYVVPALPSDLFREDTSDLRRDVLRRQPGELAWVATRPTDPTMN